MDLTDKICDLLEMGDTGEDGFTEEFKTLCHEIAGECRKLELVKRTSDQASGYGEGLTAREVFVDMCNKIVNAPTHLHMIAAAKMLIPIIDDKIQEGEKENE